MNKLLFGFRNTPQFDVDNSPKRAQNPMLMRTHLGQLVLSPG